MNFPILPVAWGSLVIDVTCGALVLRRATRAGRLGIGWALLAGGGVLAGAAAQAVLLLGAGLNPFGVIHLLYLALVVAIPVTGLGVLVVFRQRATRGARGLAVVALLGGPVGVYATFVEPFALQIEQATVPLAPLVNDAIRVGVLSDLQTPAVESHEREAVEQLMALEPDLVVLPGDFYQAIAGSNEAFESRLPGFREIFERLSHAPHGAYLVLGNVDNRETVQRMTDGTGVRVLVNEVAHVEVRGRAVSILGLELEVGRAAPQAAVREFGTDPRSDDVRLVVSHYPDTALLLEPGWRIDLIVAGHTHGGQIVVPGWGPPMTLTGVPRAVAAGGLHQVAGRWIYVSRGLGLERGQAPRMRFFCPPEVALLGL